MSNFQVNVIKAGSNQTDLIKALRVIAELELKEAKGLAMRLAKSGSTLVAGVDEKTAKHIAGLLEEAGATASVEPSNVSAPLFLRPEVDGRYQWSRLKGRVPAK